MYCNEFLTFVLFLWCIFLHCCFILLQSPYKKLKVANQTWVGFTNISKLDPNKAYKILNITETNHASYGPGQQATIEASDGRKWRTQLPGKYLAQLSKEDIDFMKRDVLNKKNVFSGVLWKDAG